MDMSSMLNKFRSLRSAQETDLKPEVEDKQLVSLQRQRNIQINEMEKKRLRKVVSKFNKEKMAREVFGIKGPLKTNGLVSKMTRKNSLLRDDKPLLKEKTKNVRFKLI